MAEAVIQPDEIALNGVHYRIDGPVATQLASVYSPKTIIGEYTLESRPRVSVRTWNDWRGGLGLNREREKNHNQFWYGTCETSFHRHLTLVSLWTAASMALGNSATSCMYNRCLTSTLTLWQPIHGGPWYIQ